MHEYTLNSLLVSRFHLVGAIIKSGYNIDLRDEVGNNALHNALLDYTFTDLDVQFLVITELLLAGIHIDTRNMYDISALPHHSVEEYNRIAVKYGYYKIVESIKILPLICLSARALSQTEMQHSYIRDQLPPRLLSFYTLHTQYSHEYY